MERDCMLSSFYYVFILGFIILLCFISDFLDLNLQDECFSLLVPSVYSVMLSKLAPIY